MPSRPRTAARGDSCRALALRSPLVRRECRDADCFTRQKEIDQEQRVFIAARDGGHRDAAFRVEWMHYAAGSSDQNTTFVPSLMLRIGSGRIQTLYLDAHYLDGGGGIFLSRHPSGTWAPVAKWYGGC